MTHQPAKDARERIDDALDAVEKTGEPVAFERNGEIVAVLLSPKDFALLKDLRAAEDEADLEAVRESLAEPEENVPWERLKTDLGL